MRKVRFVGLDVHAETIAVTAPARRSCCGSRGWGRPASGTPAPTGHGDHCRAAPRRIERNVACADYELSPGRDGEQPGATNSSYGRGFRVRRVAPGWRWFAVV
jgi:hypothetical protein